VKINEIKAKVPLYQHKKRGLPYDYDLNIYRGCSHGCIYCYGRKSHQYLNSDDFEKEIFVKVNIAEKLDQYLTNHDLSKSIINLGGVCDSYQEIEGKYQLMPEVLKVLIKHKQNTIITTKSDLIVRDLDLIKELSQVSDYVNIALTITHSNPDVTKYIEPGSSTPQDRFHALKQLKDKAKYTALHFMPILPCFSDDKESLEQITRWAAEAEVDYMMTGMLYLTNNIKPRFFNFLEQNFPDYLDKYQKLYQGGGADKKYKGQVHGFLNKMKKKYSVNNSYAKFLPKNQKKVRK